MQTADGDAVGVQHYHLTGSDVVHLSEHVKGIADLVEDPAVKRPAQKDGFHGAVFLLKPIGKHDKITVNGIALAGDETHLVPYRQQFEEQIYEIQKQKSQFDYEVYHLPVLIRFPIS